MKWICQCSWLSWKHTTFWIKCMVGGDRSKRLSKLRRYSTTKPLEFSLLLLYNEHAYAAETFKIYGTCNVKMCKYNTDKVYHIRYTVIHTWTTLQREDQRDHWAVLCSQPWIAWLHSLSTQPHWFEDPFKVMHRQNDQLSLFKVRVFIKIDRLTGRYFEATDLTFIKRQHSTRRLGPFPAKW